MRLNKKELDFIVLACHISDGVFDYSMDEKAFQEFYKLSLEEAYEMVAGLKKKANEELHKRDLKTIAKDITKRLKK